MKVISFLSAIFTISMVISQTQVRTIDVNGQNRSFRLYVPTIYDGTEHVPLVFNFHGYTSNATEQEFYGYFRPIADTANFILVMPEGLDVGGGTGWNSFANTDASNYDYQFVSSMIDELSAEFLIDSTRIYSTGMSNGGFLSYDLACFMSHKFAAIASVTGGMISTHANSCNPGRPVPVMQIHGTLDPTVSYSGTGGIVSCLAVETLVSQWVQRNGCSTIAIETNVPNINVADNTTAVHYKYLGTENNSVVEFYKINLGGHTWPGADFPIIGQNTNQDFDASSEIWRFFSQHSLNPDLLSVANEPELGLSNVEFLNKKLIINYQGNHPIKLTAIDLMGKLILEKNIEAKSAFELPINDISEGLFFVLFDNKIYKFLFY